MSKALVIGSTVCDVMVYLDRLPSREGDAHIHADSDLRQIHFKSALHSRPHVGSSCAKRRTLSSRSHFPTSAPRSSGGASVPRT